MARLDRQLHSDLNQRLVSPPTGLTFISIQRLVRVGGRVRIAHRKTTE